MISLSLWLFLYTDKKALTFLSDTLKKSNSHHPFAKTKGTYNPSPLELSIISGSSAEGGIDISMNLSGQNSKNLL
jgi:hypothetical protein